MPTYIDPFTFDEVRIVAKRQARPNLPTGKCPFCPGGLEAPEDYDVRYFKNRFPALENGKAEVLLFSPNHAASLGSLSTTEVTKVLELFKNRYLELSSRKDVQYVLIFENRGREVGATIDHPHGQIYAFESVPKRVLTELLDAKGNERPCIICNLEELNEPLLLVDDNSEFFSICPRASRYPFELVISSYSHVSHLGAFDSRQLVNLADILNRSVGRFDKVFQSPMPYMLWIHQSPCDGKLWKNCHFHIHMVGIWRSLGVPRYVAAGELGSGVMFNPVEPLDAAKLLREAIKDPN